MIPMIQRIEILSKNPAMSRMIPRMITAVILSGLGRPVRVKITPVRALARH
jgi:hypothetical protein